MRTDSDRFAARVESGIENLTGFVSWIWLCLIALIVATVVLRYVFGSGRVELEELEWHLYAVGFLMGIVSSASRNRHVRVDVFRERMKSRTRAWVELYGILLLQLPFISFVAWSAVPFLADSFVVGEQSASAGGLPFRWILKAFLPLSMLLLSIATVSQLLRVLDTLFGSEAEKETR